MKILKTAECTSLSGQSILTYQVGCNTENEVYISLAGNSGKGIFSKEPIVLEQIYSLLASQKGLVTSGNLMGLFEGKSSNTAGFLLAAILAEGFLKVSQDNQKQYELIDEKAYEKIVKGYAKKKVGKKRKNG